MVSSYRPSSLTTNVARAPAADADKPAIVNAVASPSRPVVSAYAPLRLEMQRGDLPAPALRPITNVRGLF
jgi:hypothetical protein